MTNYGLIHILDPISFNMITSRFILTGKEDNECLFYHFLFESPNIIIFGLKDKEGTKIRSVVLGNEEIKQFI